MWQIQCDKCWSINTLLINKVEDILKYDCHKNGCAFVVQDHGWTLTNGSLDCFLFMYRTTPSKNLGTIS